MSAKTFSRDFASGKVKKLQRIKQPISLLLPQPARRNPVVQALVQRSVSGAAGKHIRSQGAQRRADRMALQRSLRRSDLE